MNRDTKGERQVGGIGRLGLTYIHYWYYVQKRRGTKEPLEEGERGEWKSWLKTQYLKAWDHSIRSHHVMANESESCSVVSDSLWPHGLYSPWNAQGQNTGVDSLFLLQGIFPTQELNWGLLHRRQILYQLNHQGSEVDGESRWGKMKTVTDFIFGGSKITMDSDCSHEIKRCLLLGRKDMINLGGVLKIRYHFADNKSLYS